MFGDYGLYCGRTFFGLVCDNQLYVKITESGLKMFPQQEQGCPLSRRQAAFPGDGSGR
ncbi:MAG: TfoX/Sxy family protein [Akkermansia muciniphila]